MANWCITNLVFHGEKEQLLELNRKIWTALEEEDEQAPSTIRRNWLGTVAKTFGLNPLEFRCRGSVFGLGVVDSDAEESFFFLNQEDAYAPNVEFWARILKQGGYDRVQIEYSASAPETDLFLRSDRTGKFFPYPVVLTGCIRKDQAHPGLILEEAAVKTLGEKGIPGVVNREDEVTFHSGFQNPDSLLETVVLLGGPELKTISEVKDYLGALARVWKGSHLSVCHYENGPAY